MTALYTVLGIVVLCGTLREIFRDLFQPSGSGALSSFLGRMLFWFAQRAKWLLSSTGPLTIVAVIAIWSLLIAIGFGLIYWPHFPQQFQQPTPEPESLPGRIWSVLYFSLASLTTLSSGGLVAQGSWLRMCTVIEALLGVGLVTASVTWIVLIYPALGRMRAIARWTSVLGRAHDVTGSHPLSVAGETLLNDFAQRIIRARIDFIHFPLIYYFHADTEGSSLAHSLSGLLKLAREASADDKEEQIRFGAAMLEIALNDLAEVLSAKFLPKLDPKKAQAVFRAVAADHLQRDEQEGGK